MVPVAGVNASTTTPAGHVSLCSASQFCFNSRELMNIHSPSDVLCIPLVMIPGSRHKGAAEAPGSVLPDRSKAMCQQHKDFLLPLPTLCCRARKVNTGSKMWIFISCLLWLHVLPCLLLV